MSIKMEFRLSKEDYELILSALETYYYHCRDESDNKSIDHLLELEESLRNQIRNYENK